MNNPFLKYVMKDKKDDVFHSSAYGRVQNGASMGAASSRSFAERREAQKNRKVVGGFEKSGIMGQAAMSGPRAKTVTPPPSGGIKK